MVNREERTDGLIHIIGAERAEHSPEVIAAAERELIRRLGGTRKQALKRIRWRGVFFIVVGLVVLLAPLSVWIIEGVDDILEDPWTCVVLAVSACISLVAITIGLAVLAGRRWVFEKHRLMCLVRSADLAAAEAEPPLEDLLAAIGPERHAQGADEITRAECQVTERLERAREETKKRVKGWGTQCLLFASFCWPGTFAIAAWADSGFGDPADALFDRLFGLAALGSSVLGSALLAVGAGLRRWRDWARRGLVWWVWGFLAIGLAVVPLGIAWMALTGISRKELLLQLAGMAVSLAFSVAIFWQITRSLTRPEVREACGMPARSAAEVAAYYSAAARRLRARRILRLAAVMGVFTLACWLAGIKWFLVW